MIAFGHDFAEQLELYADDGESPVFDATGWRVERVSEEYDDWFPLGPEAQARPLVGRMFVDEGREEWREGRVAQGLIGDLDVPRLLRHSVSDAVLERGLWTGCFMPYLLETDAARARCRELPNRSAVTALLRERFLANPRDTLVTLLTLHV